MPTVHSYKIRGFKPSWKFFGKEPVKVTSNGFLDITAYGFDGEMYHDGNYNDEDFAKENNCGAIINPTAISSYIPDFVDPAKGNKLIDELVNPDEMLEAIVIRMNNGEKYRVMGSPEEFEKCLTIALGVQNSLRYSPKPGHAPKVDKGPKP